MENEVLPPDAVLSKRVGLAAEPKDFEWIRKNVPCQAACPAGTDIPGYLDAISHGDYDLAYRINLRDNVFPAVLGRVCTRPCEPACRHGWEGLGEPVAICHSKRSAESFMHQKDPVVLSPSFGPSGRRIAVIGGGAAGLTVARELVLLGHAVTVFERYEEAGGMMVQGIPEFRLPRDVVLREIEQIRLTGVDIRCGVQVGRDVRLIDLIERYDAIILSAGTIAPSVPLIPGGDLAGIVHGLPFLLDFNRHQDQATCGNRVVVIGGGFTAVDCSRVARRLGAENVRMCYRRSLHEMYITPDEVKELEVEQIAFDPLVLPMAFEGDGMHVTGVRFAKVRLGDPDATGRRSPEPIQGTEYVVPADTVLLGTGQTRDLSWVDEHLWKDLAEGESEDLLRNRHRTAIEKVFVAGDFATGAGSIIDAIGHAKSCSREVDRMLMGEERLTDVVRIEEAETTGRTREMDTLSRQRMPVREADQRSLSAEVEMGFTDQVSRLEAGRCYLCNHKYEIDNDLCIYCDRCLKVKPVEKCIVKVDSLKISDDGRITGYRESTSTRDYNLLFIDQSECIRCGACADVCPVECISLQRVDLRTVRCCDSSFP